MQIWVSVFLTWWVVPLTLLLFWNRYLDRQEFVGTVFHSVACGVALSSGIFLHRVAGKILSGAQRTPFPWPSRFSPWRWAAPVATGTAVTAILTAVAAGAVWGVRSGSIRDNYWPRQTGVRSWVPKVVALYWLSAIRRSARCRALGQTGHLETRGHQRERKRKGNPAELRQSAICGYAPFIPCQLVPHQRRVWKKPDLLGANLEVSIEIKDDLSGAAWANADVKRAAMARAKLDGAEIKYADFTSAQGLTADQLRAADGWCEAFYDETQIHMLGLPRH